MNSAITHKYDTYTPSNHKTSSEAESINLRFNFSGTSSIFSLVKPSELIIYILGPRKLIIFSKRRRSRRRPHISFFLKRGGGHLN